MKPQHLCYLTALLYILPHLTNGQNKDTATVKLHFLDEYIIPSDVMIDNTKVGGLSGIDYQNGEYYLIVDTSKDARYYKVKIALTETTIDTVIFDQTVFIDKSADFFKDHALDPESIRYLPESREVVITSEGSIENGKDPSVFMLSENGTYINHLDIPEYFRAEGKQRPRHNGVFEGLCISYNQEGFWVSTELPLRKDSPKPKLYPTSSYTRITYYNKNTRKPTRQFAYKLDGIAKIPWSYFAVNGVTELLEYKTDHFLVLERAYAAGHGSHGNTVKIFEADASKATNTLDSENLRKTDFITADKTLVFNFKSIKDQLTDNIIDNIEGMCLGPVLPNGKQSLLLISDNNFNSFAKQLTQVFLFEIIFE